MKHTTISGRILYTSRKPGREGEERGRESFTFTRHGDGSRTLRALCEIEEPDPTVLRDVACSLDANDLPTDCFVRLMVGDQFMGAGLFRIADGFIECESFGPGIGRVSQKVPLNRPFDGFGAHPISCDAYIAKKMDKSKGPHARTFRTLVPSADHRGATPPIIAETSLTLAYVGDEEVTVAAGTFSASHFKFTDPEPSMAGSHPDYHFWVTADDDAIFLKGGVDGYMMTWYELVELTRR